MIAPAAVDSPLAQKAAIRDVVLPNPDVRSA